MKLTKEQQEILEGKQGETKAKIIETLIRYGDIFDASELIPVTHGKGHLVTSFGLSVLKPVYRIFDEMIAAGLKVDEGFSVDPRPIDYKNVKANLLEKFVFNKFMYGKQTDYEEQLKKVGLINSEAFTCACYFDEIGNLPKEGDVLSWAESSAVNYANSVLGARCNRNSGMIDVFGSVIGYVPKFGFLTDEGRKANWIIKLNLTKKPEAQILGSAIGLKVMDGTPYIYGLDKWIGTELNQQAKDFLKDFGAATASNGAVGLYHADKITPEAKRLGEKLILKDAQVYEIDDEELERVYKNYPIMWKDKSKKGELAFIGCPHLSKEQLNKWSDDILNSLKANGRKKVSCRVVISTPPAVREEFSKTEKYQSLVKAGVKVTSICPLMYTNNPLTKSRRIMTCSNKLRTYSLARYYKSDDLLKIITSK